MIITKRDIEGAKITKVFSHTGTYQGYPFCEIYFEVDRGFVFSIPTPGSEWKSDVNPKKAIEYSDTTVSYIYAPSPKWMFWCKYKKQKVYEDSEVKKLKKKTIKAVLCDVDYVDSFDPEGIEILFDDGTTLTVSSMAFEGLPVGLEMHEKLDTEETFVDFFSIKRSSRKPNSM